MRSRPATPRAKPPALLKPPEMPFILADRREPALLVTGADNGIRTFTREAWRARVFTNAEAARDWATKHLLAVEYISTVLLNARQFQKKNPESAGRPIGVNSTTETSHANPDQILHRPDRP